jgi:solute carrier family 36 (proton-coupled amino acid transporter)
MVKLTIAVGVGLGYAIQFFVAIQVMLPTVKSSFKFANQHPFLSEILFRSLMVLLTFAIAELVPNLDLLLSLVGSVCSTLLALVLPVVTEFAVITGEDETFSRFGLFKNSIILLISILGFLSGAYESLSRIFMTFFKQ